LGSKQQEEITMANFIQVQLPSGAFSESATPETIFYVNVETVRYVTQNPQNPDRSAIHFIGDDHALQIDESAASFVSRTSPAKPARRR
jgi:hypothetical protein